MPRMISALLKRPGEIPRHVNVSNSLEALQKNVGGYIEAVTIAKDLAVICDEEGRLKGKPHNCNIADYDFVGDILMVGVDGEDFADLPVSWHRLKVLFPRLWTEPKRVYYNDQKGESK